MNRTIAVVIVGCIAIALLIVGAVSFGHDDDRSPSVASPDQIRIGGPALEQNALIYVAMDRGFFEKRGLNVTIRDDYPTGVEPVREAAAGVLDMSVSSEYPVTARILSGGDVSIIATIDKYQNEELIARRDAGVRNISDLNGKRIGIPRGTILEFFLGRLLALNGMRLNDVILVDIPISHSVDAIADGEIDAMMSFEPYVSRTKDRLGDNAISWPGQGDQLLYGVIAARDDWLGNHTLETDRFMRSLDDARQYSLDHPDEMEAIVKSRLNMTDEYLAAVWPDHGFALSLDRSLLLAMNDEARWMIENNLTSATSLPSFQVSVNTTALKAVRPDAVNIQ